MKKDDDLNDLMSNLKENERKLKMVKMNKNITTYKKIIIIIKMILTLIHMNSK